MNPIYPTFSVIIPQKDRAEYLKHTIRTCMIQDYPNFEIIVSDDCSDDNSVEVVKELMKIDSRIKLFDHKTHLGMRDNFEFALNQVQPGYVIALGGDDGLLPGCIWKMYDILTNTGREVLTWPIATFSYPINDNVDNILTIKRKKKNGIKIKKSKDFFDKLYRNFIYLIDDCPMFYMKGVVSTNLIDKVKSRTKDNSFYYCPTPDGFSGIVIAGEVEDYAYTNEPLSIGGSTTKSQGLNYHRTDEKSRKESEQFFNDNIRRTMHKSLSSQPYSPLVPLMTADYILTARDLPGWPGTKITKDIDFEHLINVTFKFISNSKFDNSLLTRELKIIQKIAIQHNQIDLFNSLLVSTKQKINKPKPVFGTAITNSLRFNGAELGISNIFDAAIATPFIYNFYNHWSPKQFITAFRNSYKIWKGTKKYELIDLPSLND